MTATRLTAAALAAAMMLGTGAIAQESGDPIGDAGADVAQGLSVGQPEGGSGGGIYVATTHGDWEIRCIEVPEGQVEPCQMYQLLQDENGNDVAEVNVFDLPDTDPVVAGATIVTPLDTLLTPQLRLQIGTRDPLRYPFSFCQQVGCFVRVGLTEQDLEAFRAGAEATVTIVPLQAPDQTVDLTMSLSGFTAAFNDLGERLAAAQEAAAEAGDDQ
ncbi:invasion associated locus B family protein [Rhodobacterales bacterium HKCCE2091]|nr:invasion associated locus B family protein [Rhodobacterales bacterium HKCCE2091]